MKRAFIVCAAVAMGWLGTASASSAQVFVRAPFVRVATGGGGTWVRAPFVNLWIPDNRVYYPPVYGPPIMPGQPVFVPPPPIQQTPKPMPNAGNSPAPAPAVQAQTLDAFAKSFQAKAGNFEVTLLNPQTNQPTTVRFSLPAGTPRRVIINRNSIEWVYALRTWVRIEFDRDGAIVTSR